jgi:glycosyltransferase involved in cell wall biosynthesis
VRLLFVKERLAWPRSAGHDVHCFYMMQALARLGHTIGLLTLEPTTADAQRGLDLSLCRTIADVPPAEIEQPLLLSRFQERFRSYWGVNPEAIRAVGRAAEDFDADTVIVVGLNVLPYLGAVDRAQRVWYAADEWAWHHLSQLRLTRKETWGNLRQAAVKGLYERAYRRLLDRVWVVSDEDRRAMRWVAGVRDVDVIPNGVDSEHYDPVPAAIVPHSCVFWGRLDFGPNVQALSWFCQRVWPELHRRVADARFTIYGFQPGPEVTALADAPGITLRADLPDLRAEIAAHAVAVLPFVSGGGIKNKLLEAASLSKAIVCTPRACGGLRGEEPLPVLRADGRGEWIDAILALWKRPARGEVLGRLARQWVQERHTWEIAARNALRGLEPRQRRDSRPVGEAAA